MESINAHRPVTTPTVNPNSNDYPAQLKTAGFISSRQFAAVTSGDAKKIYDANKEAFELVAFISQRPLTNKQVETIEVTVPRTTTANSRTVQSSTDNSLNDMPDTSTINARTTTPTPPPAGRTPERTTTANSRTVQSSTDNSLNDLPDSSEE